MASWTELPEYQCFKVVRAAPLVKAELLPTGAYLCHLQVGDDRIEHFEVPASVFARDFPKPGDFLVHYDHGYISWSPRAVFQEGYRRKPAEAAK